ncbi:hypothetical protein BASA81_018083 [Batrachochytrium salamandrivorans]|nr:hypothetical protein BASA81_018083 [Batrachochytrium salamandrivorans]
MRLISFAVISLLAITVSAYPGLGTSAADDAPQCDRDVIKQKIQELAAAHQEQHKLIKTLEELGKVEEKEIGYRLKIEHIKTLLEREDLPEDERPNLQSHYVDAVKDLEKAQSALMAKQQQLKEAREQRYSVWVKVRILEENLEQKAERNAKDKSKTGASSSLNPHRDILQKQINEGLQDANDLVMADQDILSGMSTFDDVITRTKGPKKNKLEKIWKKFVVPRQKIVREVGSSKGWGDRAGELQTELGWPTQNSRVWNLYQSFWLLP